MKRAMLDDAKFFLCFFRKSSRARVSSRVVCWRALGAADHAHACEERGTLRRCVVRCVWLPLDLQQESATIARESFSAQLPSRARWPLAEDARSVSGA